PPHCSGRHCRRSPNGTFSNVRLHQSALAPENLTTLPHFSVSSAISLLKSVAVDGDLTMKKILFVLAVELLIANVANAATDQYEGCLEYNKPVTLTGTVLLRKINYEKNDVAPPENSVQFPLLVLDQPICLRPSNDFEYDIAEEMEWTLHISDTCVRIWPKS